MSGASVVDLDKLDNPLYIYTTGFVSDAVYGIFKQAAVASANALCNEIGNGILRKGGNAAEAIIATAICIGAVEPQSSGLGGGHFLTVYNKTTKSCHIFDARETAPSKATETMYSKDPDSSKYGWKSIAIPGEIHGFWTAYKTVGGNVPWKSLWQPTIDLCRKGFNVANSLSAAIKEEEIRINNLPHFDHFKNQWTKRLYLANETIFRLNLAETMRLIANAEDPVKFFYNSSFTKSFVDEIQANGGFITLEDMNKYATKHGSVERPPIYTNLTSGINICGPPPPSAGGITASILNIIDGYNINPNHANARENMSLIFHRFAEAMKFAYGLRYNLGDMDYLPAARYLAESANLHSYGNFIRDRIKDKSFDDPYYYGQHTLKWDNGTSPMAVIDQFGNAASITSSINT